MAESINFGKPLVGAPCSFEDSLHNLSKPGIASTFRCYFPEELAFEALVQDKYSLWRKDAPICLVRVVGFLASYVTLKNSGHSLSFEARYAIVKKIGRTAKNHYLALFGPDARHASVRLATEKELLASLIATSPFQAHIERKQLFVAQVLAKHYKGEIGQTPIVLSAEFTRNKFMEEAFRAVRVQRMEARELAQQKVLEAASIHFTHFHGDLNAKLDGLVGGTERVRRADMSNSAAGAAGLSNANSSKIAEEADVRNYNAALREEVQAWSYRLESHLRTLAKA